MLVVKGKGKEGYLASTVSKPSAKLASYGVWEAETAIVMAWLVNSMEPKIGITNLFYKTTCEIWKAAQEMYFDLENTTQCFQIRSLIQTTRQGTNSVTGYFNTLTKLWQEMDLFYEITWECSVDGRKYNKMVEKEKVFDFLHGLNLDLDEVRGKLLGTKSFPSIREVFTEVRREESFKKVMFSGSGHSNNEAHSPASTLNSFHGKPSISAK